uniref:Uncharacterized protein n=1 Tax=Leersia perrieri TaxID=77586 RepID=A0A0D9VJI9_9ORYZ
MVVAGANGVRRCPWRSTGARGGRRHRRVVAGTRSLDGVDTAVDIVGCAVDLAGVNGAERGGRRADVGAERLWSSPFHRHCFRDWKKLE